MHVLCTRTESVIVSTIILVHVAAVFTVTKVHMYLKIRIQYCRLTGTFEEL